MSDKNPVKKTKKIRIFIFISLFDINRNNDIKINIPPVNGGFVFFSIKVLWKELFLLSNKKLNLLIK